MTRESDQDAHGAGPLEELLARVWAPLAVGRELDVHLDAVQEALGPQGYHSRWREDALRLTARAWYRAADLVYRSVIHSPAAPPRERVEARLERIRSVLEATGNIPEALREMEVAAREARDIGAVDLEARARERRASRLVRTGRLAVAREQALQALVLAEQAGDEAQQALCRATLARVEKRLGRDAESSQLSRQALDQARLAPNTRRRALVYSTLGNYILPQEGRLLEARQLLLEALQIHQSQGALSNVARELSNLAGIEEQLGDHQAAIRHVEAALELSQRIQDRPAEAYHLNNLAVLRAAGGEVGPALRAYARALEVSREVNDAEGALNILINLAVALLYQGEVDRAETRLDEAEEVCREQQNEGKLRYVQINRARALRVARGDLASAEEQIARVERSLARSSDDVVLVHCWCERGHLSLARGLPVDDLLQRAEELAVTLGVGVRSAPQAAVRMLARAARARAEGHELIRGSAAEDIPPGLSRLLVAEGVMDEPCEEISPEAILALVG